MRRGTTRQTRRKRLRIGRLGFESLRAPRWIHLRRGFRAGVAEHDGVVHTGKHLRHGRYGWERGVRSIETSRRARRTRPPRPTVRPPDLVQSSPEIRPGWFRGFSPEMHEPSSDHGRPPALRRGLEEASGDARSHHCSNSGSSITAPSPAKTSSTAASSPERVGVVTPCDSPR
jgi:hypothetical protein